MVRAWRTSTETSLLPWRSMVYPMLIMTIQATESFLSNFKDDELSLKLMQITVVHIEVFVGF